MTIPKNAKAIRVDLMQRKNEVRKLGSKLSDPYLSKRYLNRIVFKRDRAKLPAQVFDWVAAHPNTDQQTLAELVRADPTNTIKLGTRIQALLHPNLPVESFLKVWKKPSSPLYGVALIKIKLAPLSTKFLMDVLKKVSGEEDIPEVAPSILKTLLISILPEQETPVADANYLAYERRIDTIYSRYKNREEWSITPVDIQWVLQYKMK